MSKIRLDIDTREHQDKNQWILDYFFENDISYRYVSMPTADYSLTDDKSILVDRKSGLMEVAQNCFQDHTRFRNEMIRAKENNQKLYILIEDEFIYNLNGVQHFKIPRYKSTTKKHKKGQPMAFFNPETLMKTMQTQEEKYGIKYMFCSHWNVPRTIIKILTQNVKS